MIQALQRTAVRLGLAMGVFVLSTAVVVSTPTNAQALSVPKPGPVTIDAAKGFKFGITKPSPVGWMLAAGFAGWWAYDNHDAIVTWFGAAKENIGAWLNGEDGSAPGGYTGGGGPSTWGPQGSDAYSTMTVASINGRSVTFSLTCTRLEYNSAGVPRCNPTVGVAYSNSSSTSDTTYAGTRWVDCKNTTTNVVTRRTATVTVSVGGVATNPPPGVKTVDLCSSGEDVIGFQFPPQNLRALYYNHYGLAWGTGLTEIDPEGIGFKEFDVVVTCKNATTGATQTISETTPASSASTVVIPSCKARLGDDWYGTKVQVTPVLDPDTLPEDVPLWDVPDFPPWEWDEEIPDEVQPCDKSKSGCTLGVWIDDNPCEVDVPVCKNWKTKVLVKNPARVECIYGSKPVNIKWCYPLQYAYDSGKKSQVDNGTKPGIDEDTGVQIEDPATPKPADPATDAPSLTVPSPGAGTESCWQDAISLNPLDWVFTPVKCALQWAFIPKVSTWGVEGLWETLQTRPPGSIVIGGYDVLSSAVGGFASGGCGLGAYFGGAIQKNVNGCAVASVSGWATVRGVSQAGIVGIGLATAFAMVRSAFSRGGTT